MSLRRAWSGSRASRQDVRCSVKETHIGFVPCIARALIRNPRVLILDEATSALDPATEEQLLRQLKINARGRTVIMVTHRLAPLTIADRVALVMDGRIEKVGSPNDVLAYARIRMSEETRRDSLRVVAA